MYMGNEMATVPLSEPPIRANSDLDTRQLRRPNGHGCTKTENFPHLTSSAPMEQGKGAGDVGAREHHTGAGHRPRATSAGRCGAPEPTDPRI